MEKPTLTKQNKLLKMVKFKNNIYLRCTRTDDEDVNGDGHEDFISSKNLRTLQYGTGVLSFRILAADRKLTNNI